MDEAIKPPFAILSERPQAAAPAELFPRLSDDEVWHLVTCCQQGRASAGEKDRLARWMVGTVYKKLIREGHAPQEAEDYAMETFARVWRAIEEGRFRLDG